MSAAVSTLSDIIKRNDAVNVNPPNPIIDLHITEHGSDWLWAVFSVFALFAIVHGFIYSFTDVRKSGLKRALLTTHYLIVLFLPLLTILMLLTWAILGF